MTAVYTDAATQITASIVPNICPLLKSLFLASSHALSICILCSCSLSAMRKMRSAPFSTTSLKCASVEGGGRGPSHCADISCSELSLGSFDGCGLPCFFLAIVAINDCTKIATNASNVLPHSLQIRSLHTRVFSSCNYCGWRC